MSRLESTPPTSIAILRALHIGDLLCSVPAFRALRAAFPEARITLIGLPWARDFVERFSHYLDDLIEFPGFPGIPEVALQPGRIVSFLTAVQKRPFDLLLQMHGSGIVSNQFAMLLSARLVAGYFLPGQYCPDPSLFLPYPSDQPEVRRHLRLMEFLGVPLQGEHLEFPLLANESEGLHELAKPSGLVPGRYVCIHPGARAPARRWPPDRFAVVADAIAARGLQVVITGTADEIDLARSVAAMMKMPSLNLAGRTSLGALAVLLSSARLLICNDTGVSHIAAALGTPSVIIFTGSDPNRWAPLDRERHRVVHQPVECSPCPHFSCPIDHRCAMRITPERVLAVAEGLLQERPPSAA